MSRSGKEKNHLPRGFVTKYKPYLFKLINTYKWFIYLNWLILINIFVRTYQKLSTIIILVKNTTLSSAKMFIRLIRSQYHPHMVSKFQQNFRMSRIRIQQTQYTARANTQGCIECGEGARNVWSRLGPSGCFVYSTTCSKKRVMRLTVEICM